jgi:hypothetical protein
VTWFCQALRELLGSGTSSCLVSLHFLSFIASKLQLNLSQVLQALGTAGSDLTTSEALYHPSSRGGNCHLREVWQGEAKSIFHCILVLFPFNSPFPARSVHHFVNPLHNPQTSQLILV